jgi:hypothetical protein
MDLLAALISLPDLQLYHSILDFFRQTAGGSE